MLLWCKENIKIRDCLEEASLKYHHQSLKAVILIATFFIATVLIATVRRQVLKLALIPPLTQAESDKQTEDERPSFCKLATSHG